MTVPSELYWVRFYVQGTPRGGIRRLIVVEYRPVTPARG